MSIPEGGQYFGDDTAAMYWEIEIENGPSIEGFLGVGHLVIRGDPTQAIPG